MATAAATQNALKRPQSPSLESFLPASKRASPGTAQDPVILASSPATETVEDDRQQAAPFAAAMRPKRIRKAIVGAVISYKSYNNSGRTHYDDDITETSLEGVYGRTGEAERVCREMHYGRDLDEKDEDEEGCWESDNGEETAGCRTVGFEVELSEDEAEAEERERELKEAWQKGFELGMAKGMEDGLRKGVEQGVQKVMGMRILEEQMSTA